MNLRNQIFSALLVGIFSFSAVANEGGGEGEKKEEAKAEEKKAVPEWVELQSRLSVLKAKVAGKEKAVSDLLAAKNAEKDPAKSVQIFNDLKREHSELGKAAEEYEQVRNVLRYRYPEKGMKEDRAYERVEVKSLEDLEKQAGLEGNLKRTIVQVRRQYADPSKKTSEEAAAELKPKKKDRGQSVIAPAVISK